MASDTIQASLTSLKSFLSSGGDRKFIIPEYQRPYRWTEDNCARLWEDVCDFFEDCSSLSKDERKKASYFFGTVVTCETNRGQELIDGQQRVTSFMLLLKAVYDKLRVWDPELKDKKVKGITRQIEPCIWNIDEATEEIENDNLPHIETLVINDKEKAEFISILKTACTPEMNTQYAKNYRKFLSLFDEFLNNHGNNWEEICVLLLNNCQVLPLDCVDFSSAMRIFNTLNDRGEPLTDADIFKSNLYAAQKTDDERAAFINDWNELTEYAKNAPGIAERNVSSLDKIFMYYCQVLRAQKGAKDRVKGGIRRFFTENHAEHLKAPHALEDLKALAEFWSSLDRFDDDYLSDESKKWLHVLTYLPFDVWRLPISTCLFAFNKDKESVKKALPEILKKLLAVLLFKYMDVTQLESVRTPCCAACPELLSIKRLPSDFVLDANVDYKRIFDKKDKAFQARLDRAILLLNSYLVTGQPFSESLKTFDIEHIFPQSWSTGKYQGITKEEMESHTKYLGNRMPLSKKTNIKVSNNCFDLKCKEYGKDVFVEAQILSKSSLAQWTKSSIEKRQEEIESRICMFWENTIPRDERTMNDMPYREAVLIAFNIAHQQGKLTSEITQKLVAEGSAEYFGGHGNKPLLYGMMNGASTDSIRENYYIEMPMQIGGMTYYLTRHLYCRGEKEMFKFISETLGVSANEIIAKKTSWEAAHSVITF